MADVMKDPAFVANLLQTLPGVDPNDPGIKVRILWEKNFFMYTPNARLAEHHQRSAIAEQRR